ncbi:MAG TPA: YdcF family protein [Gemmatimonadaceae bacterium]|jgi:uncharacterized SAM-binding protein YcdF (DUF218 family)
MLRAQRVCHGALLGALGGFVAAELGVNSVLPGQVGDAMFVLIGAVVGALFGLRGWTTIVASLDGLALVTYFAIAFTPLMSVLAPRWVRVDTRTTRPDALMVLSSSVLSDSALDETALDRLLTGIELAERDSIPRFVTSRVEVPIAGGVFTSDTGQRRTVALAHLTARWDVVDSVKSTRDEALRVARLLLPAGAKTIVVVTSPMHTRRACATFEAVGFTVTCQPALEHEFDTWHPRTPASRVAAFRSYLYERLGMVKYRMKGWVRP